MLALRTVTYCTENEETPTLFFTFFFGPPLWCAVALTSAWRARPGWWWLATLVGLGYALGIREIVELTFPIALEKFKHHRMLQEILNELVPLAILYHTGV